MRLPRNTPAVLATSATAPTAHTPTATRDLPRFGEPGGRRSEGAFSGGEKAAGDEKPEGGEKVGGDETPGPVGLAAGRGAAPGAGHFEGGDIGDMHTV